ncbi:MAG: 50S ribosomal protein L30 [Chloroflexi bacterium]|nr:50S ribosomal protein L30 [Chloroflexota bacterium]
MQNKVLRITYVRSAIGFSKRQKATIKALGLRHIGHTVEQEASAPILGMVASVRHLVRVEEVAS